MKGLDSSTMQLASRKDKLAEMQLAKDASLLEKAASDLEIVAMKADVNRMKQEAEREALEAEKEGLQEELSGMKVRPQPRRRLLSLPTDWYVWLGSCRAQSRRRRRRNWRRPRKYCRTSRWMATLPMQSMFSILNTMAAVHYARGQNRRRLMTWS